MQENKSDILGVSRLDNSSSAKAKANVPSTPTEIKIAKTWQAALPGVVIHRDDNFIVLGGDSLGLAQVISEIEKTYAIHLSVEVIANNLTLADMAAVVDQLVSTKA